MPLANAVFDVFARNNAAASMTVMRDRVVIVHRASGNTVDSNPATPDSPMIVASVSKLVTAFAIARLDQQGLLDVNGTMPWELMGFAPNEQWNNVTIRELLDHTSGMPVARQSWFDGDVDCRGFLPLLLSAAPESNRGVWRYSNGNYCALGVLVEFVTGQPLDTAIQQLVFDPLGINGLHLSTGGLLPADVPYFLPADAASPIGVPSINDVDRLSRLGGAGIFIVSTEDLAAMVAATTPADIDTLRPPGVFTDQYGWGHTGTVSGAVSCIWVFELGRTVVSATIAGNSPAKGGTICDRVVPAIADDLGIGQGLPIRTP
jgi:CubicO group peptidase (beta-lactamase class C family)